MQNPGLRKQLWENVSYTKIGLKKLGFSLNDSPIPIICLHQQEFGSKFDVKRLQEELFKREIAVTYIPEGAYTSVPKGGALRISIFSSHSHQQIDRLITAIGELI